jgi:hypothetical protein
MSRTNAQIIPTKQGCTVIFSTTDGAWTYKYSGYGAAQILAGTDPANVSYDSKTPGAMGAIGDILDTVGTVADVAGAFL